MSVKSSGCLWCLAMLLACVIAFDAAAQLPRTLSYQGVLKQADGSPVAGPVTLTVSLYESLTGGSAVWTEIHQDEPLASGVYSITLGKPKKGTPVPLTLAFDKPYYLQVTVGNVDMGRHELTSVPYALRAASLDQVTINPTTPQISLNGKLWVSLKNGQPSSNIATFESRNEEPPYINLQHHRTGGTSVRYGYIQAGDFGSDDKRFMFVTDHDAKFSFIGNYVGIGTPAPTQRLDVAGGMRLSGNLLMPSSGTGILGQADRNFVIYQNTSAYNSRAFIEMWGDHATRAGELALGGTYVDLYCGSTTQLAGHVGLRLTQDGKVGIGTTTPVAALTLPEGKRLSLDESADDRAIFVPAGEGEPLVLSNAGSVTNPTIRFRNDTTGSDVMIVNVKTGNVGIGRMPTSTYMLDVNGKIRGSNVAASDARWKTDIAPLDDALAKVTHLRGVTYRWKEAVRGTGTQIGLIAQEVEPVFPELVSTDDEGYKSVAYEQMVAPLIEAIKTLKAENDALKAENTTMREEFEQRFKALEAQIANQ